MESNTSQPQNETEAQVLGFVFSVDSLYAFLRKLQDSRKRRGVRYSLTTVLCLLILAKLCGQNKPYGIADWVQARKESLIQVLGLRYPHLPHHSTYRRILESVVDADEVEQLFHDFLTQDPQVGYSGVVVIDGKTLRGTISNEDPFGLHLLAAYLPGEGLVLMQMVVEKDKENEIAVAPKLLEVLDLRQKIVVADAMHTQRRLSTQIVEAGGEYVWIVKDNQPTTRQAIEQLFVPEKPVPGLGCPSMGFASDRTVDKAHGRIEERQITVSSFLNDYLNWPEVEQVFKLERRVTYVASGKARQEVVYGLTSLRRDEASPERLLEIVRSAWGIENGLHYRRDVTFEEDKTRMKRKTGAQVMAAINNLVNSLLAQQGDRNHARTRRFLDADPCRALAILCGL